LVRPLSKWWCALGWLSATALFVCIVQVLGGPSSGDADETTVSSWPIAHGQFACAFPKGRILVAPLYPFVSGGVSAIARLGNSVPFPTRQEFGPGCSKAFGAVTGWGVSAGVMEKTLLIGYVGWLALLVGAVALLRACGRGRCGWEPVTLLALACLPPVWMCLENFFHPQDLLAMGLVLGALACARRGSWIVAGILVTLAAFSQQFALLVAAPLFVVTPDKRRWAYAAAVGTTAAVALSGLLVVSSSPSALGAALLGSGNSGGSGTVLSGLHLHGGLLVFVSRLVPLELSLILAWWASKRLGPRVLEPVPLLALVALSLSLRLVFEHALYGYYFMAFAVLLLLLDVAAGRIRAPVVAWLAGVSVVYLVGPTTSRSVWSTAAWEHDANALVAPVLLALALAMAVRALSRNGPGRAVLLWLALAAAAALAWPSTHNPLGAHVTGAWWQIALVASGVVLAAGPLTRRIHEAATPAPAGAGRVGAPP
jgi:hypothetical protein